MRTFRHSSFDFVILGLTSLMIAVMMPACGTTETRALQNARVIYSQAQNNPGVALNASATLNEAALALQQAEKEKDPEEQRHLAQIAETRTRQAVAEAQERQAEKQAVKLEEQKTQTMIQAREREAAQAKARSEAATREMEMAQQEAQASQREAERSRRETMALRQQLEELQARETERGLVLTLGDIYFGVNRAELEPGAALNLTRLADFLRRNPDRHVFIEGHTDSSGNPGYNLGLSQHRADSVKDWLIANGVNPYQISAMGFGESFPVASNASNAGRQQNRRVDIIIQPSRA